MRIHGGFDWLRVTATQRDHQRDTMVPSLADDELVAIAQPFVGEREAAEFVAGKAIHAGLEEYDIGAELPYPRKSLTQSPRYSGSSVPSASSISIAPDC